MFRIALLFLIFYFGYSFYKKFKSVKKKKNKKEKIRKRFEASEKMLRCENCGVYFPESSNIRKNGKNFCSKKCLEEYYNEKKA